MDQRIIDDLLVSARLFLGPVRLVSKADAILDYAAWNDETILRVLHALGWREGQRIAYLSTYSPSYTRTEALLHLLERNGVAVDTFIEPKRYLRFLLRLFSLRKHYDLFVVGFRGHEILPFVRFILGRRKHILFDAFVSAYDTLCFDRQIVRPTSLIGRFLRWYDRWLCRLADAVLVDTQAHARYFRETFGCQKVETVYVDCNRSLFKRQSFKKGGKAVVLWYGNCLPVQGVEKILRWVKSLESRSDILFRLIGPVQRTYRILLSEPVLTNVEYIPWVSYGDLPQIIASADICLAGQFGDCLKASRVIAGKTYQMLACCDRVIIADNEANREIFGDGK
ncbi:MAG: hypothetical protein PHH13_04505 [Candidatus Peribacteraceae bacterium]|nr:hypothetical protein [Candidatus Peribacteraceae bacterium]